MLTLPPSNDATNVQLKSLDTFLPVSCRLRYKELADNINMFQLYDLKYKIIKT